MRAALWKEPGVLAVESVPDAKPEPGEILSLPYMSCGTCEACVRGDGMRCGTMRAIELADVPEAFRALERPTTQCKVLIEFP